MLPPPFPRTPHAAPQRRAPPLCPPPASSFPPLQVTKKATEIATVKDDAERDLAAAKPALDSALAALDSIKDGDIKNLKALKKPPQIISRIFDCVLLLRHLGMNKAEYVDDKGKQVRGWGRGWGGALWWPHCRHVLVQPACVLHVIRGLAAGSGALQQPWHPSLCMGPACQAGSYHLRSSPHPSPPPPPPPRPPLPPPLPAPRPFPQVLAGFYSEAYKMISSMSFLSDLKEFAKEQINDETVELLEPYFMCEDFNFENASKASGECPACCVHGYTWCMGAWRPGGLGGARV